MPLKNQYPTPAPISRSVIGTTTATMIVEESPSLSITILPLLPSLPEIPAFSGVFCVVFGLSLPLPSFSLESEDESTDPKKR